MAVNDGIGNDIRDPFPGIAPWGNRAPGSAGASGAAADDTGAGPVTPATGAWQPAARYPASTGGTVQAGQVDANAIEPGPAGAYADTGAGSGSGSHYPRRPGQQPNRGA